MKTATKNGKAIALATLTDKQRDIYEFVEKQINARGYGPTVREIGIEFGIRSPNGVMCHLKALERKGLISRESHLSRAIELVYKDDDGATSMLGTFDGTRLIPPRLGEEAKFGVYLSDDTEAVILRTDVFMPEFMEGDMLAIRPTKTMRAGNIILLAINGELSLKRFIAADARGVTLESVSGRKGHRVVPTDKIEITGVVVGCDRTY